jgi:hypothetical protein
MRIAGDEQLADDLVLGIWAAIALLDAARRCPDIAKSADLLSKAERILSGIIPHIAQWGLIHSLGSRRQCFTDFLLRSRSPRTAPSRSARKFATRCPQVCNSLNLI